jgi:hypothetical protein
VFKPGESMRKMNIKIEIVPLKVAQKVLAKEFKQKRALHRTKLSQLKLAKSG